MSQLQHNLIRPLLLVVFAAVSLCGQGLHFLPGANHLAADAEAGCCVGCSCGFETSSTSGTPDKDRSTADHDCPICKFFAQGQSLSGHADVLTNVGIVEMLAIDTPQQVVLPTCELHSGRGPPA